MALTDNQKKAVAFVNGNALINAGAGSGKSTVLIARIANLIANENVNPNRILGLTFTNEAAENMRTKLANHIGKAKASAVTLTTFHSFAYRWLKANFPLEYANKKIMEPWWKMQTLYDIVGECTSRNPSGLGINLKAGDLAGFISYQKANMILPDCSVIVDENVAYVKHIDHELLQIAYQTYCNLVKNARVLDFDDMLMDFFYALQDNPTYREELRSQYEYVMVDEFQDTNTVNLAILKLITDHNLFVVGDFRQGIYGFINATIDNILNFQEEFEDVTLIELCENFRSQSPIVSISNNLIAASPISAYSSFSEQLAVRDNETTPVTLTLYQNDSVESDGIINKIIGMKEENPDLEFSNFCILCRTNAQLGIFESKFADYDIPVDVSSSKSFFDRKEISDLLAYAAHAVDSSDDMALRKIFNSPTRFISKAIISELDEYSFLNDISLEEAIRRMDTKNYRSRFYKLLELFEDLREDLNINAGKFLKKIYHESFYEEHIIKKSATHSELILRKEAVERLFDMAKKFTSINSFLSHVSVIKNNNKKNEDAVHLMTVHASKGLEFDTVFVPSINSKNYPHEMNLNIEEERRVLYVALSRAINNLFISTNVFLDAKQATVDPSPFLMDIAGNLVASMKKSILYGSSKETATL